MQMRLRADEREEAPTCLSAKQKAGSLLIFTQAAGLKILRLSELSAN